MNLFNKLASKVLFVFSSSIVTVSKFLRLVGNLIVLRDNSPASCSCSVADPNPKIASLFGAHDGAEEDVFIF